MTLRELLLSEYGVVSIVPSPVNRMMEAFAVDFREKYDVNLGVGYVNEDTIPRERMVEAMNRVLADSDLYRTPLNYGASKGSINLVESIRRFLAAHKISGLDEYILSGKQLIIGTNGATSLLEGVAQILKPGIVITTDPVYYIYCDYLERIGYKILAIPEDGQGLSFDLVDRTISKSGIDLDEISFFYVITVNNPTGTILTHSRVKDLVRGVTRLSYQLRRKIPIFFDRAYEGLIHDPRAQPPSSGFFYDDLGIVYEIGSLSKILAPGLRIGYMIGEKNSFLAAMIQRASDVGFSAALINQEIASYLLDYYGSQQLELVKKAYRRKAVRFKHLLQEHLGRYLEKYTGGQGGFYYYLTFKEIETHQDSHFFNFLARTTGSVDIDGPERNRKPRVSYIPGSFCVHKRGELVKVGQRQLRLSYGFEAEAQLEKAVGLMKEAAEFANGAYV